MKLRELLAPLSRSSAESVRTLENSTGNPVKDYLYIETPIEKEFRQCIDGSTSPKTVIFLCGSSGDGKSEILTKLHNKYNQKFLFHLDATHSFRPDKNAIQTLDDQFFSHKSEGKPIVVGINIGMLGNYAEDGTEEHSDIIYSIKAFLSNRKKDLPYYHIFLNFEDYPKFKIEKDSVTAEFIQKLLEKLTQHTDDNFFYQAWLKEKDHHPEMLHINYEILQMREVQNVIIDTLFKVRLKCDQFLTARTLLDFIYSALTGPRYLFDNIFTNTATDLNRSLVHFDPCTIRSKDIDIFMIQWSMNVTDENFNLFKDSLQHIIDANNMKARSWIRCFYLFKDKSIGNNYHQKFKSSFTHDLYKQYVELWRLHNLSDSKDKHHRTQDFLKAIFLFANRLAPELGKKQWYLADYNGYSLSTPAVIRYDPKAKPNKNPKRLGHFNAMLMLNNKPLEQPLQISANFLELIMKIKSGYRPNKHDKNNIVILEEFVGLVTAQLQSSHELQIQSGKKRWVLNTDEACNTIDVDEDY